MHSTSKGAQTKPNSATKRKDQNLINQKKMKLFSPQNRDRQRNQSITAVASMQQEKISMIPGKAAANTNKNSSLKNPKRQVVKSQTRNTARILKQSANNNILDTSMNVEIISNDVIQTINKEKQGPVRVNSFNNGAPTAFSNNHQSNHTQAIVSTQNKNKGH